MGAPRRHGFTLIELILVIGIFAMVLTMAYQTLISTLEADQRITRNTRSGKIGEAILTIIRRDLQGAIYRGLGTEVFRVVDGGSGESADDTIDFLTTAPIPDPTDGDEAWVGEVASVGYVLKRGSDDSNTLFRRVKWNIADGPLEGGQHFPIYNRVMGLELRLLDREEWAEEWDSSARFPDENLTVLPPEEPPEVPEGEEEIPEDVGEDVEEDQLPLPLAVEVVVHLLVANERDLIRDEDGNPVVERYSTVVPLLVMDLLDLEEEEDSEGEENGGGGR